MEIDPDITEKIVLLIVEFVGTYTGNLFYRALSSRAVSAINRLVFYMHSKLHKTWVGRETPGFRYRTINPTYFMGLLHVITIYNCYGDVMKILFSDTMAIMMGL